ncbi:GTPase HflX [Caldicellulosiruptoraceae bacterium PP1]
MSKERLSHYYYTFLKELEGHYIQDGLLDHETYEKLKTLSNKQNSEIGLIVSLNNKKVKEVLLGQKHKIMFSSNEKRLKKEYLIHTHLNGTPTPSTQDLATLINGNYIMVITLSIKDDKASIAFNTSNELNEIKVLGPFDIDVLFDNQFIDEIREVETQRIKSVKVHKKREKERVLLVDKWGLYDNEIERYNLNELENLCITAGAEVVDKVIQIKKDIDPAYYIGKGKAEEIKHICTTKDIDTVVFNCELSPAQIKNLEELILKKVIDRTDVILDIFAKRAKTNEGKLQVELAQLKTVLPRLTGYGKILSRLGGGIGTRGPGEKKLETDRRHILRRIHEIEEELKKVKKTRELHREFRKKNNTPVVAIIGYTNAGKSTLMNRISKASVYVEDKLFATLDTTVRKVYFKGVNFLLSDTVGFIRNLPHHLIEAFSSTLEEVKYADLILNVVDISDPFFFEHIRVSEGILKDLEAGTIPIIRVYNKIDKVEDLDDIPIDTRVEYTFVSATNGDGIENLLDKIVSHFSIV